MRRNRSCRYGQGASDDIRASAEASLAAAGSDSAVLPLSVGAKRWSHPPFGEMRQRDAAVDRVLDQALEIIPGRFGFLCGPAIGFKELQAACGDAHLLYCIDDELEYEPFYGDFGPLNMGHTFMFCTRTASLLQTGASRGKIVYLYTAPHAWKRANAAALVGIFQTLFMHASPADAYSRLAAGAPYDTFRDASTGESMLPLTVLHVIEAMHAAEKAGFLPWTRDPAAFDLEAYQHYEQVQNGDLNWILPGKLLAFAGPTAVAKVLWGYRTFTPEDYWGYFREHGVSAVVRLNNKLYEGQAFRDGGFAHHELYFPDGSCPTNDIVLRFLDICEGEAGGVAVHCKAGLGRTGVLICCYIMKHYGFTAEQAIAYIRICRPGSVIGPQQTFLKINERELWRHGDVFRAQAKAKAADGKQPAGKKRSVIDISVSATAIQLPERPGPLPGATASPLQDAKAGRAWTEAALVGDSLAPSADGQGPLAAGQAANATAAAEEVAKAAIEQAVAAAAAAVPATPARRSSRCLPASGMPPLPAGPTTRSAGFRAALRDIMGMGGSSGSGSGGGGSFRSGATTDAASPSSRSGVSAAAPPPASPEQKQCRQPAVAAIAKASPRYLAPNGQPRKGFALPGMVLKGAGPKAARGLDFGSCGSAADAAAGSWKIAAAEPTASS